MGEEGATLADLFALAIAAEESAETLYRGLAIKFSRYADVADFWRQYAAEESGHALWLMRLRDRLDTEQLATPADPFALENVYRALHMSVETALAQIQNLEDAYQLVNDIESSETNAVFSFLVTNFAYSTEVLSFLQALLEGHIARLMGSFPSHFRDRPSRLAVEAQR